MSSKKQEKKKVNPYLDKLHLAQKAMSDRVFEREVEIEGILATIISGTSCLFLGDVGTAKTKLIELVADLFGMDFFNILMSETTKPELIFGPTDIPALAKGTQRYKMDGYAGTADIVFFDEIYKANAVVLTPTLRFMNEGEFRNGDEGIIKCPRIAVFAASNEVPQEESLKAVHDRLLLRFQISKMKKSENIVRMVTNHLTKRGKDDLKHILTKADVHELNKLCWDVTVPAEVIDIVLRIKETLEMSTQVKISDRRFANAIHIIQAVALLHGKEVADVADAEIVANIFWDTPDQADTVRHTVTGMLFSSSEEISEMSEKAEEVWNIAIDRTGDFKIAKQKLEEMFQRVKNFTSRSGKKLAHEIEGYLGKANSILENRNNFVVTYVQHNKEAFLKVAAATAGCWNQKWLNALGFHLYKTSAYYYISLEGKNEKEWLADRKKILPRLEEALKAPPYYATLIFKENKE